MGGDYTRMTFRPRRNYSGVLMQQGKVQLDADFNELVELVDRRLRAETVDIVGRCVVPTETPDGFRIEVSGGKLTVGPGRAYVHGLLAENHGADPAAFDPVLSELRGTEPVDFTAQPYLPDPEPLPRRGTHVAYLDVWQREVTHLEDPGLVEKAIAIDTATRVQTVWQVKLLHDVGDDATCTGKIEGWDSLTEPSAGRLTTAAVGVPTTDDPCIVPPSGGYRGTENRLYRVEIHDAGPLGTATFKWSRDNASVGSSVTAIDATGAQLDLVRVGRDAVMRIRVGDWVEVTDDHRELAGLPGDLREVTDVEETRQTIRLAAPLTAGAFDASDPARHTRVRRWDGGALQTVPAPAAPIVLDADGVQITFDVDPAGGSFHAGDHWVFAARTADASVEALVSEPPRGIHHHFCRLAVVTFPDGAEDCRTMWPGETDHGSCDCTVCVSEESHASGALTIQMAVDRVGREGGKICLGPGVYRLRKGLRIAGAQSLRIEGKGFKTLLVGSGQEPAIAITRSLGVWISDLMVVVAPGRAAAGAGGTAVALRNTIGTTVERCVLLQTAAIAAGALTHDTTAAPMVAAPSRSGGPVIGLDALCVQTLVRDDVIAGTTGIGPLLTFGDEVHTMRPMSIGLAAGPVGDQPAANRYLMTFGLAIADNILVCARTGVSLEGFSMQSGDTRIAGNLLAGSRRAGIVSNGMTAPGGRIDIAGNLVRVTGVGIVAGTDDTRVVDNDVVPVASGGEHERGAPGILLAPSVRPAGIDRCIVSGNRVLGGGGDGVVIATHVVSAQIEDNVVQGVGGGGIVTDGRAVAKALTICGNQLLDVCTAARERKESVAAIRVERALELAITGNTIDGVGRFAVENQARAGIVVSGSPAIRIADNDVVDVGPAEFVGLGVGIAVAAPFDRLDVASNRVRRARFPADDAGRSDWLALLVRGRVDHPALFGTAAAVASALSSFVFGAAKVVRLPRGRELIAVDGNLLEAHGTAPAVLVRAGGACTLVTNRCLLASGDRVTTVRVQAGAIIAAQNYVEGPPEAVAVELEAGGSGAVTVVGNVTSGPIELDGALLPGPWAPLNVS